MFTGSVTENRITIGVPPAVRQVYYDEARRLGMKTSELMRHTLLDRALGIERERLMARPAPEMERAAQIARFVQAGQMLSASPVADVVAERASMAPVDAAGASSRRK